MSNIFGDYKSGGFESSEKKPSFKVSEIVNKPFKIEHMKRLDGRSKYSDDPAVIVNAVFTETDEKFIFFAQQKVVFEKIMYLIGLVNEGKQEVFSTVFTIRKTETKDGESFYYDIVDIS